MAHAQLKEAEPELQVVHRGTVVETGLIPTTTGKALSVDELEAIAGGKADREPAKTREVWYVALDEAGKPTGTVMDEPPEDGKYITVTNIVSLKAEVLMTPSGAPLTETMNPDHSHFDQGMHDRNHAPGKAANIGDVIKRNSNVGQAIPKPKNPPPLSTGTGGPAPLKK